MLLGGHDHLVVGVVGETAGEVGEQILAGAAGGADHEAVAEAGLVGGVALGEGGEGEERERWRLLLLLWW